MTGDIERRLREPRAGPGFGDGIVMPHMIDIAAAESDEDGSSRGVLNGDRGDKAAGGEAGDGQGDRRIGRPVGARLIESINGAAGGDVDRGGGCPGDGGDGAAGELV